MVIDDASTDGTHLVLRNLAAYYPELRGFVLTNGVGQSAATVAGIALPGEIGLRRWTRTCRTTRPTWYGSGMPCPATTQPWAGG